MPETSVLCRMSGEATLTTTGKPIRAAAAAASSAVRASSSRGTAMP